MKAWCCTILLALCCSACSRQGEGERCDPLNGDQDCEAGLVCMPRTDSALCCPPSGVAPTDDACNAESSFFDDPEPTPTDPDAGN